MASTPLTTEERDLKRQKVSYRFLISCPDVQHQFVDNWFPITIFVVNEAGQLTSGGNDKYVEVVLGVSGGEAEGETERLLPELFAVDTPNPSAIPLVNGRATVNVKILECSTNDSTRNFFIEARSSHKAGSIDVSHGRTSNITVINHQLQLCEGMCWEDEWYKDEGGRDKCIAFSVELRDASGVLVDRKVPLKVTLVYGNGNEVERQDILKLMECDAFLSSGRADIKARIDEVSRSHQNQPFQIKVGPDASGNPLDNDVSSVLSPPVIVRSKRNNRKKSGVNSVAPQENVVQYAPIAPLPLSDDNEAAETLIAVRSRSFTETKSIRSNDLQNVSDWVGAVLRTMEGMKWREEYDRLPDGSLDTLRPRFSLRNPNQDIDILMRT